MQYKRVCIEAFGYHLPEKVVTSDSLEERLLPVYSKVNRSLGRLQLMTGIRERRVWDDNIPPSVPSTLAAEKAIAASAIDKRDIECLLHTSVSRDFLEPATATVVHDSLGLPPTATIFDISNACLGFVNGMITLANMIELGQIKAGIIVACESGKQLTEATIHHLLADENIDRGKLKLGFASLTMGCGAVSVVLTHSSISRTRHHIRGGIVRTASQHNGLCRVDADTCFYDPESFPAMHANFEGILRDGMPLVIDTWNAFQKELGWHEEDINRYFCHQVSAVHQDILFDTLKLDKSKGFSTVEFLGNVGSVSLPISMAIGIEQDRVRAGDKVVMMAAGSGLNSIMLGVEW